MLHNTTPSPIQPQLPFEEWRAIAGYEGIYEVSSFGRVRSLDRKDSGGHPRIGRLLRPGSVKGYPFVNLCKNAKQYVVRVHRLVAAAFLGECPHGHVVNHIDADKTNNRVENLEYLTPADNARHAVSLGNSGKLTKEQVWQVRRAYAADPSLSYSVYAKKLGVGRNVISDVVTGLHYNLLANEDGSVVAPSPPQRGLEGVDVLALRMSGCSAATISREYGVSVTTVNKACRLARSQQRS